MRSCIILLLVFLNMTCMTPQTTYEYADGSANRYTLTGTRLVYTPVKLEESSTGTYSGGEPKDVLLTQAQADSLRTRMDEAAANTAIQIQDRLKGSGAIWIGTGNEKKQYLLRQGCEEIRIIEEMMKKFIGS